MISYLYNGRKFPSGRMKKEKKKTLKLMRHYYIFIKDKLIYKG